MLLLLCPYKLECTDLCAQFSQMTRSAVKLDLVIALEKTELATMSCSTMYKLVSIVMYWTSKVPGDVVLSVGSRIHQRKRAPCFCKDTNNDIKSVSAVLE
jgi:hypothetical protein